MVGLKNVVCWISLAVIGQICAQDYDYYYGEEIMPAYRRELPGVEWLVGFIDVGDNLATGVIHLRYISKEQLHVRWLAGDTCDSLQPVISIAGLKDDTHTDHVMLNYYIQSTSLEWDTYVSLHNSYCFQYSLAAPDGSIWYTNKATLQQLMNNRENSHLGNPVPIKATSIIQSFPTAFRYNPGAPQMDNEDIIIKFYVPDFDADQFQLVCDAVNPTTDERKALYYQRGQEPANEHADDVTVQTELSQSGGLQVTLTFTLTPALMRGEVTYRCSVYNRNEELGCLMDYLNETSHSALPAGYDPVPELRVSGNVGYGPHNRERLGEKSQISCRRLTALPGEHTLMLSHEGQALNISEGNRGHIQRGTLYEEWLRYSIPAFSSGDAGTYTCTSETGQQTSTTVIT